MSNPHTMRVAPINPLPLSLPAAPVGVAVVLVMLEGPAESAAATTLEEPAETAFFWAAMGACVDRASSGAALEVIKKPWSL